MKDPESGADKVLYFEVLYNHESIRFPAEDKK